MGSRVIRIFKSFFEVEKHERLKLLLLTISFFVIIASYTLAKELKDSIFSSMVGREYIPWAKGIFILIMIPAIFLYSKLVDKLRRYKLLSLYCFVYAVIGLVFTLFLAHPTIGLSNTQTSPYRLFGWLFYFFVEGFSPFVVGLFWAFANSVTSPDGAKKNYGLMVSGSKLGGMLSAAFAWALLSQSDSYGLALSDTFKHQILLGLSSVMLLFVPFFIYMLMRKVSGRELHGYEAVYEVEKKRAKEGKAQTGVFAGLKMFVEYPYIFGIFSIVFFYEVIHSVLSYQRIGMAQANSTSISQTSTFLFKLIFLTHLIGFFISLFGTKALLEKMGERFCLILIPITTAILFIYFFFSTTQFAFLAFYVLLRSIHYGFSYPVRESLYIPTVKEIKFKSKSWIDAFGTKFAKSTGSAFNYFTRHFDASLFLTAQSVFFGVMLAFWLVAAYLLGKRFEKAVSRGEVIGVKPDEA